MAENSKIKSVAIIGAGAAGDYKFLACTQCPILIFIGAVTAAAFLAEDFFEKIKVFERRESAGGTWYV